ncbi:hypothetical protein [Serratia quinivorans]|uniref:hypothetical protein n=1 Tax=Serratia quinivorans TaxID=137545 RepID=UPI003F6E8F76
MSARINEELAPAAELKRYEPDFSYDSGRPGMFETTGGGYVSVADYESLKADRDAQQKRADALAVENAERGEIIERLIGIFTASGYHAIQNSYDPCMALLYDAFQAIKHPATSAALAAIQKQAGIEAVEEAAYSLYGKGYIFDTIMDYAAELREAK